MKKLHGLLASFALCFALILIMPACKKKEVDLPNISTVAVSQITENSAVSGGNIIDDGGAPILGRGLVWSISQEPTLEVNNGFTAEGDGLGIFTSNMDELLPSTQYFVKAYATNSQGVAYGNQVSFTTSQHITIPAVTTTAITGITPNSAIGGGNVTGDGGAEVTARGICWSINENPTIDDSRADNATGTGEFTSNLPDLSRNTVYFVRAFASNIKGTAYGSQLSFSTPAAIDMDGNIYHSVIIGTQEWLVENLKTTKFNDGTSIPLVTDTITWINLTTPGYCYYANDEQGYKDPYGALYNWYTVSTGKLCPTGWRIPSNDDWTALTDFLGGVDIAGGKIKEAGIDHWESPNTGATNSSGFTGLPGSSRTYQGIFYNLGKGGVWWCSDEKDFSTAWDRSVGYNVSYVGVNAGYKISGFSVRCLKE